MVQFTVGRFLGLSVDVDGMAMVDENGITLAFNPSDDAEKLWEAESNTILVSWADLVKLDIDYGFVHDQIRITAGSKNVFGRLPGIRDNSVELDVRKTHRDALKEFEHRCREYRSGQRQNDTEQKLDDIRDFLYDFDDEP